MKNCKHVPPSEQPIEETAPRSRGHLVPHAMPERIDASPEEIAEVVLGTKPETHWRYEAESGRKRIRKVN